MKAASQFAVRTHACWFVADALDTDGHVFVYGTPGSGKTTLSLILMNDYRKKDYDVRLIRSPEEFRDINQINTNVHTFLVFDDIFGHFSPSPKEYFTYRHLFDDICSLFPDGHSNNSDSIHDQKVKVLFNCRTNVFRDTEPLIQEYRHKLFGVSYSLNRDFKSDVAERQNILKVHLDSVDWKISDADLDKVVKLEYRTLGFPLICQLYSHQRKSVRDNVVEFFRHPLPYLMQVLDELFRAEESSTSAAFLVLLMLNNGHIDKAKLLDPSKNSDMGIKKLQCVVAYLSLESLPTMLSEAANSMLDTYVIIEDDSFIFSHPTIYDAVAFVIGKKNPVFILEYCSLSFIVERVRLESDTVVDSSTDQDLWIKLGPNYKEKLLTRLAAEINEETMSLVLSQRSLNSGDVFRDFIKILRKNTKLLHVLHLRDKTASMSFLFWAAYTRIWQEDFFTILCTEVSDFEDEELIEACLGSCIVGNKLVLEYVTGHMDSTTKEKLITYKMQEKQGNFLREEMSLAYPKRHTPNDDQLIHVVSIYGHTELVNILLEVGAKPNTKGGFAMTPLMYACYFGHLDLVQFLQHKGGNPMLINDDCDNCLHLAVKAGSTDVVTYLLEELKMDPDVRGRYGRTPLMYAGYDDHQDIVNILIRNKATLELPPIAINRNNVLHEAAYHGSTKVVERLLEAGMDVNKPGYKGRTPLMLVSSYGHLSTVEVLLLHGAKVDDVVDYHGNTCFHLASQGGNVAVMEVLQTHSNNKSCLDSKSFHYQTPLMNAVFYSRTEMSYYISNTSPFFFKHCNFWGASCLHLAAQSGNLPLLKFFHDRGLDMKKKAYKDWTPIIYAMHYGQFETFQYLMEIDSTLLDNTCLYHAYYGGNMRIVTTLMDNEATNALDTAQLLDAACESGNEEVLYFVMKKHNIDPLTSHSCLQSASFGGKIDVLLRLLEMGLDINCQNSYGQTPVMSACAGGHMDIVKLLIKRGARWKDITDKDKKGNTIVDLAAKGNNPDILTYFIKKGISKDLIITDSVFHVTCKSSASKTAEMLLRRGCSVNQRLPGSDRTPLMLPFLKPTWKSADIVLTLVQHGADVNARDNKGNTCLHLAARRNQHIFEARVLLEAGLDVSATNKAGFTPLVVAEEYGQKEMVKLLSNHQADINKRNKRGRDVAQW